MAPKSKQDYIEFIEKLKLPSDEKTLYSKLLRVADYESKAGELSRKELIDYQNLCSELQASIPKGAKGLDILVALAVLAEEEKEKRIQAEEEKDKFLEDYEQRVDEAIGRIERVMPQILKIARKRILK